MAGLMLHLMLLCTPSQVLPGCSVTKADFLPMTDSQVQMELPL